MITRELSPVGFNNFCLKALIVALSENIFPEISFQKISGNMMFENNF